MLNTQLYDSDAKLRKEQGEPMRSMTEEDALQ